MSSFKGNGSGMEKLYDKYSDLLYRLALVNLGNEEDACDAVHDCFVKYMEAKPLFNDDAHEEGWFVKVTVNICRDHLRKKKYRNHLPIEEAHHIKCEAENEGEGSEVLLHLQTLSERYKTVLTLHYLEGYSVKDIADMLSISQSAVKMRLSRGRELLKEKIEKED